MKRGINDYTYKVISELLSYRIKIPSFTPDCFTDSFLKRVMDSKENYEGNILLGMSKIKPRIRLVPTITDYGNLSVLVFPDWEDFKFFPSDSSGIDGRPKNEIAFIRDMGNFFASTPYSENKEKKVFELVSKHSLYSVGFSPSKFASNKDPKPDEFYIAASAIALFWDIERVLGSFFIVEKDYDLEIIKICGEDRYLGNIYNISERKEDLAKEAEELKKEILKTSLSPLSTTDISHYIKEVKPDINQINTWLRNEKRISVIKTLESAKKRINQQE